MQKFQFKLEALRALREAKLQVQEQELGHSVAALNQMQQREKSNTQSQEQVWQNIASTQPQNLNTDYLYLMRLEHEKKQIGQDLNHAKERVQQEQQRYSELRKDLKVVEKLREKKLKDYKRKYSLHEEQQLEERLRSQPSGVKFMFGTERES